MTTNIVKFTILEGSVNNIHIPQSMNIIVTHRKMTRVFSG